MKKRHNSVNNIVLFKKYIYWSLCLCLSVCEKVQRQKSQIHTYYVHIELYRWLLFSCLAISMLLLPLFPGTWRQTPEDHITIYLDQIKWSSIGCLLAMGICFGAPVNHSSASTTKPATLGIYIYYTCIVTTNIPLQSKFFNCFFPLFSVWLPWKLQFSCVLSLPWKLFGFQLLSVH